MNISFLLVEGLSGWASAARAVEEGVERRGSSGRELEEGVESRAGRGFGVEGRGSRALEEEGVERPESRVEGWMKKGESSGEGVLGAGRWSLDARHHLALRSQGFGEAGCAAEGF